MLRNLTILLVTTLAVLLFTAGISEAAEDITPPEITAFSLSPTEVNTENQDQQITITMALTDDQAGVSSSGDSGNNVHVTWMSFWPDVGGTQNIAFFPRLLSGTNLNGIYTDTITLPKGSIKGAWNISTFKIADKLGNHRFFSRAALESRFGPGSATIVNKAATSDSSPPRMTSFSMSTNEINTEHESQQISFTVGLTDAQAGTSSSGDQGNYTNTISQIRLTPRVGTQIPDSGMLERISGTDQDGLYTTTVTLPKGSQGGVWDVCLCVADKLGNLGRLGPATITNQATVWDSTAPRITAFNISPIEINTGNQEQAVTLTVTLTDDQSGVAPGTNAMWFRPLIGTQSYVFGLRRISGTDLNGVYSATVSLPKGSKEGIWSVERMELEDNIGNRRRLTATQLNNLFPGTPLSIANTAQSERVEIERDWTISSARTSVTFPKGTVVTKKEGGRFAFYEMVSQEIGVVDSTAIGLEGEPIVALRLGIPGLNLSFSKDVSVTFDVGSEYNGYTFLLQSRNEGGNSWANEETAEAINGKVTFNVNHATQFTANLVDRTKPLVRMVTPFVSTKISKTTTFKVKWSATDAPYSTGIKGYTVRFRPSTSRTWRTWKNNVRAKEGLFEGKAGVTYSFRTKAIDNSGNIGWSKAYRTIVPFNEGIYYDKIGFFGYEKLGGSQNYLTSVRYSYKRDHALRYKLYRNNGVGLVVTKGPNMGRAKIYVDGKYIKTVDAYKPTTRPRQLIYYRGFKKKGIHWLKVVNLGTPGRSKFAVDGVVVGR